MIGGGKRTLYVFFLPKKPEMSARRWWVQHVRGQNVSIFKLFNLPFLGCCVESMRTNLSYPPIFFFDAARVLILFWGDFGQRGGGRYGHRVSARCAC